MTPSSISTCPVFKLRWKFVASSCASHMQNSVKVPKAEMDALTARLLVTVS